MERAKGRPQGRRYREGSEEKKRGAGVLRGAAGAALFAGACVGAGALLGAAGYCYRDVMKPKKHDPALDSEPSRKVITAGRLWVKGHPLREDVYLRADDGLQLHGNFIPCRIQAPPQEVSAESHVYAVCVHGSDDASDSMGMYARVYFESYGMNVLLPDLRGHGKSDGGCAGMGYEDGRDLLHWIDWILARDGEAQIVLHGVSMGAAAVLMATGESLPEQVMAAVSDSCYTRAEEIVSARCERAVGRLPGKRRCACTDLAARAVSPVLAQSVRAIALVRAGYDIALASPVDAVAGSRTPTLFIHGQEDGIVPPRMMPALYRAAACPKEFLWIPEAGHALCAAVDPETYWFKIEHFLHSRGVEL